MSTSTKSEKGPEKGTSSEAQANAAIPRRLIAYLRPYIWPWFVGALICMLIYSATSGAVPWLVRSLIDDIFERRNVEMLNQLPGMIVVVFVLRAAVNYGQAYLSEYVGQRIVYDMRMELQERIQHLPMSFFDTSSSANIVARITSDVLLVRQALTEGVASMIRDTTNVLVLIGVAIAMDPTLSLLAFVGIPIVVIPLQSLSRRMRKLTHRGLDTLGGLSSLLQETIQGARVVKAFGMEGYEKRRFAAENDRLIRLYLRSARIKAFTTPMTEVFSALGIAAVLWYGGSSVLAGGRTGGSFLAFMTAVVLIYEPFKKLVRTNNTVQVGLGAAERVFELIDVAPEPDDGSRTGFDGIAPSLRLENVCFSYGDTEVLHNVDLEIPAGGVVALVGPSGGGKSTIADLIPRFYEPSSGRVSMDGIDVREFSLAALRSRIAVVTQHTFLFNDTIGANIAYGLDAEDSSSRLISAAAAANAEEFIADSRDGYDTEIGEMGIALSGGQRQRLAIARALLKDAPILILDEATSALDNESERLVQAAIENLMTGRTTLVIAHRLSTVQMADCIAVVEDGRIVESGTHAELIKSGRLYRRLYELQFRPKEPAMASSDEPELSAKDDDESVTTPTS